jgi:hypothetical protein
MIWVIGTGRCGTKSYAVWKGGVHEPRPSIRQEALQYYYKQDKSEALMEKLKDRLKYGLCSDNCQSLVIAPIVSIDKKAKFVWLIRNPNDCIHSFMRRGGWNAYIETLKIEPKKGFHEHWGDLQKFTWYYWFLNGIIAQRLSETGASFEIVHTEDIPVIENTGKEYGL